MIFLTFTILRKFYDCTGCVMRIAGIADND